MWLKGKVMCFTFFDYILYTVYVMYIFILIQNEEYSASNERGKKETAGLERSVGIL